MFNEPAQMTLQEDGSLSISIEETNRIRASLGLKPLVVTQENIKKDKEIHKPPEKDKSEIDLTKERLEKAKWKRKERELKKIKTLGEDDEDIVVNVPQKPKKKSKLEVPLTVAHNEEDIGEGDIILTLVDKNVLQGDEDELENVELKRKKKNIKKQDNEEEGEEEIKDSFKIGDKKKQKEMQKNENVFSLDEKVEFSSDFRRKKGNIKKKQESDITFEDISERDHGTRKEKSVEKSNGYEKGLEKARERSKLLESFVNQIKSQTDVEKTGIEMNSTQEFYKNIKEEEKEDEEEEREAIKEDEPKVIVKEEPKDDTNQPREHYQVIPETLVTGISSALAFIEQNELIEDGQNDSEIIIEERDRFGRVMTTKQRYKGLSHKFHGKSPGKNKLEKERQKYLKELKSKKVDLNADRLEKITKESGKPYIELEKKMK